MAHEIGTYDNVVLHREAAWHGLGIIVDDAPTPREALKLAGMDWDVAQYPLSARTADGREIDVSSHVVNVRDDIGSVLGVVTKGYVPVSNADMADFCEALLGTDGPQVTCETAGSIQDGRKSWFLLKGRPFDVANGDDIWPYICVSNGHDGSTSFRVTPTTVRAVCSNTLHMVIGRTDSGTLQNSAFCIRHTTNIKARIEDARNALRRYGKALNSTQELMNTLAAQDVSRDDLNEFFTEAWQSEFGPIPKNPQNRKDERTRARATDAYRSFSRRFDDERPLAGASVWNAFNAFSGMLQHDMKARGKDDADRIEKRTYSNLFGLNQDRTQAALKTAFRMLV